MEKRIIFFDIDGTLLDEKTSTVPLSTKQAITEARKNGHICIVNTGRPICSIDKVVKDIGFDGYICGCGTYIEYHEKPIFHKELNEELRKNVIHMIEECHIDAVLEGRNSISFLEKPYHPFVKEFQQKYIHSNVPLNIYNHDHIVMFDKFAAWYDQSSDIECFKDFLRENQFDIIQREDDFIEIMPLGCSKAQAIQILCDYLNLSHEQTISIGDSTNDLTMLTYTKESVAMGNCHPSLLDLVTYQTTDLNDDGIYNALKHFHLI